MKKLNSDWQRFLKSGKVEDYLKYKSSKNQEIAKEIGANNGDKKQKTSNSIKKF